MKVATIRLADGEHRVRTPTYATSQLLEEMGLDLSKPISWSKATTLNIFTAAMLTAEEHMTNGVPDHVWSPLEAGALLNNELALSVIVTFSELIADANAPADDASDEPTATARPTKESRTAAKQ